MNYGPAILAVTVSVLLAVIALFFRAGHVAARVEELERWRGTIRADMREISETLERLGRQLSSVETLIRERTDRRQFTRQESDT